MIGLGTIINTAAVVAGGLLGMLLKNGIAKKFENILMQALGLAIIFIGAGGVLEYMLVVESGGISTQGTMLLIFSLVIGCLVGQWLDIEARMETLGIKLKQAVRIKNDNQFVEGFVAASLVICIGAMAIVGALEDGLQGNPSTLIAKAILDAVIVMVFASSYGKGALFSAIPVGLWQGSITLFARFLEPLLTDVIISDLSFVGNALIFCVGINLAFGKRFRVGNMLPSLFFVVLFDWIQNWL